MKNLERENQKLKGNLSTISAEVKNQHRENKTLAGKMEEAEENYEKVSIMCSVYIILSA